MTLRASFVGGGNMAIALIGGVLARGTAPGDIRVVEPSPAQRERLGARFPGIATFAACDAAAIAGADVVVLAVKPQQMKVAAEALAPHVAAVPMVLTIAAGIRIGDLSRWLGGYRRIVRAMPNTPALVGAGISGLYAGDAVPAEARALAARVLDAGGEVLWVDAEERLDAITGVSGSGPAYVFYFLEGLERAARDLGFDAAAARKLAYATFDGAMKLARASDAEPATLRAQVTSKGGTTERAVSILDARAVQDAIVEAVKGAAARGRELGDEFGRDA